MGEQPKFDYGATVRITGTEHRDCVGNIVGISGSESPRTYTVEFGDGSDSEIPEEFLSKPTGLWFHHNWKWLFGLLLAGLLLSRFTVHFGYVDDDKKQAAKLIEQFHDRMNTERFDEIYEDAHPAFRKSLSKEEWLRQMQENRQQYGPFKMTSSSKINVIMGAPVQIRAAYNSTFEKGEATELFGFAREGHKVQLLIYGISPATTQSNPSGSGLKTE
jgi:hypothetical protein